MLSPALAAGMLLAFTLAIEDGVPAALGTRAGVVMLTTDIEKNWQTGPWIFRGVDAFCGAGGYRAVGLVVTEKLTGHHDVTSVTGKPTENSGANAGYLRCR
jgi:iron(III) transport system permease protein